MFQGRRTTDTAAVISGRLSGPHTLNHDHGLQCARIKTVFSDSLFQFLVGDDGTALSVTVFGRGGFRTPRCQDRDPVFECLRTRVSPFNGCVKAADLSESPDDPGLCVCPDQRVFFNPLPVFFKKRLGGIAVHGPLQPPEVSAQMFALFHKVDRIAVVGNGKGCRHAGDTPADNQRLLRDRNGRYRSRVGIPECRDTHSQGPGHGFSGNIGTVFAR